MSTFRVLPSAILKHFKTKTKSFMLTIRSFTTSFDYFYNAVSITIITQIHNYRGILGGKYLSIDVPTYTCT